MSAKQEIDRDFQDRARIALQALGVSATEFCQRHPNCSKRELAEILGNGVTSRGLTMLLFEEAEQQSSVRSLAQDLLFRKIIDEFPEGWFDDKNIRVTVKLGSWHYDIFEFAPQYEESSIAILKALSTTNKPNAGWKPITRDDKWLQMLFEAYMGSDVEPISASVPVDRTNRDLGRQAFGDG